MCGVDLASSGTEAVTYFGMVQNIFNLFSSSPHRWQILQQMDRSCSQCASICSSFTEHKSGTAAASGLESTVTVKTTSEVNGAISTCRHLPVLGCPPCG